MAEPFCPGAGSTFVDRPDLEPVDEWFEAFLLKALGVFDLAEVQSFADVR